MMASPRFEEIASSSVSNRRIWTVQVTLISSQIIRARSTLKPAGLPSGPVKLNGGESVSGKNRITEGRDRPGRSGRRRGSQKPGTACGPGSATGLAADGFEATGFEGAGLGAAGVGAVWPGGDAGCFVGWGCATPLENRSTAAKTSQGAEAAGLTPNGFRPTTTLVWLTGIHRRFFGNRRPYRPIGPAK